MPARSAGKVKVYVRTRPTNQFAGEMIAIGPDNRVNRSAKRLPFDRSFRLFQTVDIHRQASANVVDNKIKDWTFRFDGVFHNVSQEEIFNSVAKDVVDRALDGYNGPFNRYAYFSSSPSFQER